MDVGKRICRLRESRGWTTNRLANNSGLSQSFLRAVELGEKGISVENLQLICDTLEVSMKQFFDLPENTDTADDVLLRQLGRLTQEQKRALSVFLETMG